MSGASKLLTGKNKDKAIRARRASWETFEGTAEFKLVDSVEGVLSLFDVDDAERVAGSTKYRAIILKAHGSVDVYNIRIYINEGEQATYELAVEELDSNGEFQEISNEDVAPAGLSWVAAVNLPSALHIVSLDAGESVALWIKRTFPPAGVVSAEENVEMVLDFEGI
jgi:hypothetical protein